MVDSPVKKLIPSSFHTIFLGDISTDDKLIYRAALYNLEDVKQWVKDYESLSRSDWIVLESNTDMEKYNFYVI